MTDDPDPSVSTTRAHVSTVAIFLIERCGVPAEEAAERARELLDACGYGPTETTCRTCGGDLVGPICPSCQPSEFVEAKAP